MKKYFFFLGFALILLGFFSVVQYVQFHDQKLHLIFCDVGQGDGIIIRTPSGKIILVDGGPDEKILDCLSRHTPFWERTITLMLLSHPHADHLNGLISVVDRYLTKHFVSEKLANNTTGYNTLHEVLMSKQIPQRNVFLGDSMSMSDGIVLRILSPTKKLLTETSPNGIIGESKEFANLITQLSYKDFTALLVGDSQAPQVEAAASLVTSSLDVLQVPHHGSLTGLSEKALTMLKPKLAVVSVGKNSYGHPAKYTLELLKNASIPTRMTIQEGDIEIISDGKTSELQH